MMSEPTTPSKDASPTNNPKTHCPVCRLPEIRYAHPHCPPTTARKSTCTWLTCKCGTIWDTLTGRWNPPTDGKAKDEKAP